MLDEQISIKHNTQSLRESPHKETECKKLVE